MFSKEKNCQSSWVAYLLLLVFSYQLVGCSLFYKQVDIIEYRVESGDTLSEIADRFQVSMDDLIVSNSLVSPDHLEIGQLLAIPYSGQKIANKQVSTNAVVKPSKAVISPEDSVKKQLGGTKFSSVRLSRTEIDHVNHFRRQLYWPVDKELRRISSKFGWRRRDFHEGLDLAAKTGTPIYAAHSGTVLVSGYQLHGYGRMVIVQSGDFLTVYAHHSQNYVDPGQRVQKGEKIAAVGTTGKVTGPHLHFEVRVRNKKGQFVAVDPMEFLS